MELRAFPETRPAEELLVEAASNLRWAAVPEGVRSSIGNLFFDWLGSAIGGSDSDPVATIVAAGRDLGIDTPTDGATVIPTMKLAAPLWACFVNGASSHVVEMDDLHNGSIYHPGTCVFPAALAAAEAVGAGGRDLLLAALAGYEVSIRLGEALGPEHYVFFHTTGTTGTVGAAVAVGLLLGLDRQQLLWALGNAGTQASGLWQFLADGAMSKQLHSGKAALNGLLAAYLARRGFTGPREILLGTRGLLPATTPAGALELATLDADLRNRQLMKLLQGIEPGGAGGDGAVISDFKTEEVSYKYHASCRHTHPVVDALLTVMRANRVTAPDIAAIHAHVYSVAYDRLKDTELDSPWAAKFHVPFCLARAAQLGHLGLAAFTEEALQDLQVLDLMSRIDLVPDADLDRDYPRRWASWAEVETRDGAKYVARTDFPKGDPENPLTFTELKDKFRQLTVAVLGQERSEALLRAALNLESLSDVRYLLSELR